MHPTLSVVMPNYNHGRFVEGALEAIAAQSFDSVEIVVVDDHSTDNSVEVIERFGRGRSHFVFLRNESNQGAVSSFSRGRAAASGDYVYLAAADDVVLPGLFEKSMDLLTRYPGAGVATALVRIIDEDGTDRGPDKSPKVRATASYLGPSEVRTVLARRGLFATGNTCIYRRGALDEFGAFDPELEGFYDGFLAHAIAAKHGACFIPEPLVCWRRMPTGFSQLPGTDVRKSMRIVNYAAGLMRTTHKDLFPEAFVREYERRAAYRTGLDVATRTNERPEQAIGQIRLLFADKPIFLGSVFLLLFRISGSFWLLRRCLQVAYLLTPSFVFEKVRSWRESG